MARSPPSVLYRPARAAARYCGHALTERSVNADPCRSKCAASIVVMVQLRFASVVPPTPHIVRTSTASATQVNGVSRFRVFRFTRLFRKRRRRRLDSSSFRGLRVVEQAALDGVE